MDQIEMIPKRLNIKRALITPASETTALINYSELLNILEVEYKEGHRVYHYLDVEPSVWDQYKSIVESGGSSGSFVNQRIKPFYKAIEIEPS